MREQVTSHGGIFNENMSNVLKDIPEDIMSKAPAVRNRRLSLKRSDFEDNNGDEMTKNQIDKV